MIIRTALTLLLIFSIALAQEKLLAPVALIHSGGHMGSAFIVGERGDELFLLSAAHVIVNPEDTQIEFRGFGPQQAKNFKADPDLDIVVFSCPRPPGFTPVFYPFSTEGVKVNEPVIIVGHPVDNNWEINKSNRIKERAFGNFPGRFAVHPTGIGPGSSGGPVLNQQGELLGLVTDVDIVKGICVKTDVLVRACTEWGVPLKQFADITGTYTDLLAGTMVLIEGGTFTMGGNDNNYEKPMHRVTVKDFHMGAYEVTQAQWRAVMKSDPPKLNFPGCDECPVEQVSWKDIQLFITQLNKQTGLEYRLPTEAEWEYAAGGGAVNRTAFGGTNSMGNLGEYAWYFDNSENKTHPVGQKKPNGLGLYDMIGNVIEFCEDDWHPNYQGAPKDGRAWVGNSSGSGRVCRGGSWIDRTWNKPNAFRVATRGLGSSAAFHLGFRLAQ